MTPVARNTLYNVVGQTLVLALSFVAVKFIYGNLGQDVFGIIAFSQALSLVLTNVLELGISSTTVREVSAHLDKEPAYIAGLIGTASLFYWTAALLILIVVFLSAPLLVHAWINLRSTDISTATMMIRILAVSAAVLLPKVLYSSLFRGIQRMGLTNSIDVGTAAMQQIGIVVLLSLGVRSVGVALWITTSAVLGTLTYLVFAGRRFGWPSVVPRYSGEVVRRNLHFLGHMTGISVLALIQTQADKIIVSKLLPIADLGIYGFAYSTVTRATFLTSAISQAAFPSLSKLFNSGDQSGLRSQYQNLHDLVAYSTIPIFAGVVFAAPPVYGFLFGSAVAARLFLPTALLSLAFFMNAMLTMPYVVTLAVGRPQIASRLNLWALILILPTTTLLIYYLGLVGAGLSWIVYHLFAFGYMVPRVYRECLETSPAGWYLHFAKVLGLALLTYGVAWRLITALDQHSIALAAIGYVVGSGAFLVAGYVSLGPALRSTLNGLPRRFKFSRAGAS